MNIKYLFNRLARGLKNRGYNNIRCGMFKDLLGIKIKYKSTTIYILNGLLGSNGGDETLNATILISVNGMEYYRSTSLGVTMEDNWVSYIGLVGYRNLVELFLVEEINTLLNIIPLIELNHSLNG